MKVHRVRQRLRIHDPETGFTLIEAVVALAVAALMFTALAGAALAAVRATQVARNNQQAIDIANAQIETVRQMPWGEMGALVTSEGGPPSLETTVASNGVTYTVTTSITTTARSTGERDVRVDVRWSALGRDYERAESTSVSQKSSGLPLPDFALDLTTPQDLTVTVGSAAEWGLILMNKGARDSWSLSVDPSTGVELRQDRTSSVEEAPDGVYDKTVDPVVSTTGIIDPYESFSLWAVATDTSAEGSFAWTITATSEAQSEATTGSASEKINLEVSDDEPDPGDVNCMASGVIEPSPPNGYKKNTYNLHNSGLTPFADMWPPSSMNFTSTNAWSLLQMTTSQPIVPATSSLPVFSQNMTPAGTPGRILYPGGTFPPSTSTLDPTGTGTTGWQQTATFRIHYPKSAKVTYRGTATLRLFVKPLESGQDIKLTARTFTYAGSGLTYVGSDTVDSPGCATGWQELAFTLLVPSPQQPSGTVLGVAVVNDGTSKVALAYDHENEPSRLIVVEK